MTSISMTSISGEGDADTPAANSVLPPADGDQGGETLHVPTQRGESAVGEADDASIGGDDASEQIGTAMSGRVDDTAAPSRAAQLESVARIGGRRLLNVFCVLVNSIYFSTIPRKSAFC